MELLDRAMAELHASGTFNTIIARVRQEGREGLGGRCVLAGWLAGYSPVWVAW